MGCAVFCEATSIGVAEMTIVSEFEYRSRREVAREYSWAYAIVKVCGGWAVFDTADDYKTWRGQR